MADDFSIMSLRARRATPVRRNLRHSACLYLPAIALLLSNAPLQADVYVWNDPSGGFLTDASNWTPSGVPQSGDDIRFGTVGTTPAAVLSASTIDLGFGSTWIESGSITVESGASFAGGDIRLGHDGWGDGSLFISGASQLNTRGTLSVGENGTGTLRITDYSRAFGTLTYVGQETNSQGALEISSGSMLSTSDDMHVGLNGTGDLSVGSMGYLSTRNASFGYYGNGVGTGTVSGAMTLWEINGRLALGREGTGTLEVENGGTVTANEILMGERNSGTGTLTVSNGGLFSTTGNAIVGWSGSGTVSVESGGLMGTGNMILGVQSGSNGQVNVTGPGSWMNVASINVGERGEGTLMVTDGGRLTSGTGWLGYYGGATGTMTVSDGGSYESADDFYIGLGGTGDLTVSGGGTVENRVGGIGWSAGSTGAATITGTGSQWTTSGQLIVGREGTGTLRIEDAGVVRAGGETSLGRLAGSTGSATVTGSGSLFDIGGPLVVGGRGDGTLSIQNGGRVENTTGYIAYGSGSTSSVEVGAGSSWAQSGDSYIGFSGNGTLHVEDGGEAVVGDQLEVGREGTGTLRVEDGGVVRAGGETTLGVFASGTGSANVTGTGSLFDVDGPLLVGGEGDGTLSIQNGGRVENSTGYVAYGSGSTSSVDVGAGSSWAQSGDSYIGFSGNGTLFVEDGGEASVGGRLELGREGIGTLRVEDGGVVRAGGETTLGVFASGTGSANVTGTGSLFDVDGPLLVGGEGAGTLSIQNGGRVENTTGYVAYTFGSTSSVEVSAGSSWVQSDDSYIGFGGVGSLLVEDGGTVESRDFTVAYHGAADGSARFTGAGTTMSASRYAFIGRFGEGHLTADDGAQLSSQMASVAVHTGSIGSVTLSGPGTRWDTADFFVVGRSGTGTALIEGGATLATGTGYIASNPTSEGTVLVTDAGSLWSTTGDMRLGPQGFGTLTVADEGRVTLGGDLLIGEYAGSTATLNIGAAAASPATGAGRVETARVVFGDGTGAITFNHTDTDYAFDADILGHGNLNFLSGTTRLGGDTSTFTGLSTVTSAARLDVAQDMSLDALLIDGGNVDFSFTTGPARQLGLRGALANGGLIEMRTGATGDGVSVASDYSGGGIIGVDVDLATDTADTITVAGDVLGAPTRIDVNDISTGTASGNDIVLARVGGQTQAGDFVLSAPVISGAFAYGLSTSGGDHLLSASFLPEVVGLEGLSPALMYHGDLPRLRERTGAAHLSVGHGIDLWATLTHDRHRFATRSSATDLRGDMQASGLRAGATLTDADAGLSFGAHIAHGRSTSMLTTATSAAQIDIQGTTFGTSATWRHPAGFYIDATMQASHYDAEIAFAGTRKLVSASGISAGVEVGHHFTFADPRWVVTPQARVDYELVSFDQFTSAGGLSTSALRARNLSASLGASVEFDMSAPAGPETLAVYGSLFATRQFAGQLHTQVAGTTLATQLAPWTGEATLGMRYDAGPMGSLFVESTFGANLANPTQHSVSLRAGAQISF